jgi:recombinational DNA repair protein (RecF pathway)
MSGRERNYRAEAVVLRRRDLGEADRLLTVYSREHGKLQQVAKGARRPSSRKAGHLELFTRVQIQAARGRELDVITQAEALDLFSELRSDLTRPFHGRGRAQRSAVFTARPVFGTAGPGRGSAQYHPGV